LAEDEQDMAYAVKMQLESSNFEVSIAQDGQEALEKTRQENPDLIILDIMLPKLDGYKVSRLLKFDAKYKHIPILIFTSRAEEAGRQLSLEVGADGYLTKPFEPPVLLSKIQELLK
jgi:DNA-binding response OmpR family regulator